MITHPLLWIKVNYDLEFTSISMTILIEFSNDISLFLVDFSRYRSKSVLNLVVTVTKSLLLMIWGVFFLLFETLV
jgi:hypothetical protein